MNNKQTYLHFDVKWYQIDDSNKISVKSRKVHLVKAMLFPVCMDVRDYKESWVLKNWCFWTLVLEKILESPLECKEIQPVHPKGNQSWLFIGRTDAEAETPILWPTDAKNWLIGKDPDVGKDWMWEEKGRTEDEMVGWHHWLNGHGFGWTPAVGDGQEGLACSSSWSHKESDMTERLNWSNIWNFSCGKKLSDLPKVTQVVWQVSILYTSKQETRYLAAVAFKL